MAERGVQPLLDELARSTPPRPPRPWRRWSALLQRTGVGGGAGAYVDTDSKDSTRYLLHLSQSGLGLPDESYYRDEQHAEILAAYPKHIAAMFALVYGGDHTETAARIVALETKLAAAHWDVVKRRDADLTYNLRTFADLPAEAPGFDWAGWVTALGTTPETVAEVVVRQPDYLTAFAAAWSGEDLEDWKNWARWRLIHARASLLTDDLVAEDFAFYGRTVERHRGDPRPLEARRVAGGEPDGRCRRQAVRRAALPAGCQGAHGRIGRQPARGLPRQHQRPRVDDAADAREGAGQAGQVHPEDRLSGQVAGLLEAGRSSATTSTATSVVAMRSSSDRELAKLGGPVDRDEWFMTPQTVNAYYNPGMNEIVFPAAILQPPFFDAEADDAANYGGIGAVIGHEIGHGFDDQGAKYDGDGNLVDWWTDDDRAEFGARTKALIEQYDEYTPRALERRPPRERCVHRRREHRRPRRAVDRAAGLSAVAEGQGSAGDRRVDRRAAGVLRLGPGVAHQIP